MITESVRDLARERTKDGYRSKRLARLVKLLDMEDAILLVTAYRNFPDEIEGDLEMIEATVRYETQSMVRELLGWYDLRSWTEANGNGVESIEQEKPKLGICKWWAERQKRTAQALDAIELSMKLGRLTSD
ncbi:MAG: hypothetical protein HY434_01945 [Candidatus Liptonbacteria bacterium]|nr:hypothetical protein [Candidatus Liptonbacteria bacterium]